MPWAMRWHSSHSSVVILSGTQGGAHLVVEDLRRGARQRPLTGGHQPAQVVLERLAVAAGAFGDLQRGETVDVDVGHRLMYRSGHVDVVVAVEIGMDPALQAHLGGTGAGGLHGAAHYL